MESLKYFFQKVSVSVKNTETWPPRPRPRPRLGLVSGFYRDRDRDRDCQPCHRDHKKLKMTTKIFETEVKKSEKSICSYQLIIIFVKLLQFGHKVPSSPKNPDTNYCTVYCNCTHIAKIVTKTNTTSYKSLQNGNYRPQRCCET